MRKVAMETDICGMPVGRGTRRAVASCERVLEYLFADCEHADGER
jgi:hypothetical protein